MRVKISSALALTVLAACSAPTPQQPVSGDPVRESTSFVTVYGADFVVTSMNHKGHALVAVQEADTTPAISSGHWNDGLAYVADGGIRVGSGQFGSPDGRLVATQAVELLNSGNVLCGEANGFQFSPGKVVEGKPRPEAMYQGQVSAWIFGGACK